MNTNDLGAERVGVIYFHGAASIHDTGPIESVVQSSDLRLVRNIRPGYGGTKARPEAGLRDVASAALDQAMAKGHVRVVVLV